MTVRQNLYFPTPIYSGTLDDATAMNDALVDLVYAERERDADGLPRSTFRGLRSWHSRVNLHKDEGYAPLLDEIDEVLETISRDSGYHPEYRLRVSSMWAIVNPPGGTNRAHIHPGCLWSGVYYLRTPKDCGKIEFIDPRTENLMHQPKYRPNEKRPKSRWTKVNITPTVGKLVIFPAWLYHAVDPNLSREDGPDADRVIISFNIVQRKDKR